MRAMTYMISLAAAASVFAMSVIQPEADTFRPVVRGKRGAVAAGNPLTAEAGMRLLQQGGRRRRRLRRDTSGVGD